MPLDLGASCTERSTVAFVNCPCRSPDVMIQFVRHVTRSYRLRAYPNGAQRRMLDRWLGAARWLWNTSIHDAAFSEIRRQLLYKSDPAGRVLLEVPRYFASSKTCSVRGHVIDELRLNQRKWTCPKCRIRHDRDVNAARSILQEAMRRVAGRDDRDLRVDARGACPEDFTIPVQVLADEARSGHWARACVQQASSQ